MLSCTRSLPAAWYMGYGVHSQGGVQVTWDIRELPTSSHGCLGGAAWWLRRQEIGHGRAVLRRSGFNKSSDSEYVSKAVRRSSGLDLCVKLPGHFLAQGFLRPVSGR